MVIGKDMKKSYLNIIIPLIAVTLFIVGIPIILEFFGWTTPSRLPMYGGF